MLIGKFVVRLYNSILRVLLGCWRLLSVSKEDSLSYRESEKTERLSSSVNPSTRTQSGKISENELPYQYSKEASFALLSDASWVTRRVESIDLINLNWVKRRISFHISAARIREILKLPPGEHVVVVPLGILKKELYLEFDLEDETGKSVPAVSREVSADFTTKYLLSLLQQNKELKFDTHEIQEILYNNVADLEYGRELSQRQHGRDSLQEQIEAAIKGQLPAGLLAKLCRFCEDYIPLISLKIGDYDRIVKLSRTEQIKEVDSYLPKYSLKSNYPSKTVAIEIYDIGWAKSEHLRVKAAPGTFVSDVQLPTRGPNIVSAGISIRNHGHMVSLYSHTMPIGNVGADSGGDARDNQPPGNDLSNNSDFHGDSRILIVTIWPERRGFLRPTLYLTIYTALLLIIGATAEGIQNHMNHCVRWAEGRCDTFAKGVLSTIGDDAIIGLAIMVPTILLAYFVRDNEHCIRNEMLRTWRGTASWSLVPAGLASLLLMSDRSLYHGDLLWIVWLCFSGVNICLAYVICLWWRKVAKAEKEVQPEAMFISSQESGRQTNADHVTDS